MRTTAIILLGWLAVSIAFGCLWALTAMTLKAVKRRWPQLVGDRPLLYPVASPPHDLEEDGAGDGPVADPEPFTPVPRVARRTGPRMR